VRPEAVKRDSSHLTTSANRNENHEAMQLDAAAMLPKWLDVDVLLASVYALLP
jgi:hypothetical protein